MLQPLSKQQNLVKLIIWAQQHYTVFHWHPSQVYTVVDVAEFCSVQQYIHSNIYKGQMFIWYKLMWLH